MFLLAKPSRVTITVYISERRSLPFSYSEVGGTRDGAPDNYTVDHNRAMLGRGADVFERAKRAIAMWKMFDVGWIELSWPDSPVEVGTTVAVLVSHFGFWSLNPARIVYVVDERGPVERYGFAYGTLPGHSEIGEERFTVEFNREDQSVWYDLHAFSRPAGIARIGRRYARKLQRCFIADSQEAMRRAVS